MWDQDPSLNFRMSCKVCFRWSSEKGGLGVHYSMCALGSYTRTITGRYCTMCNAGKHRVIYEATSESTCEICLAGAFQDMTGSSSCKVFVAHSTSAARASTCHCNAGYGCDAAKGCVVHLKITRAFICRLICNLTCKRGSVGQSEGLSIPRSSVRFRINPDNSNSHGFELHRPSNKGTKLLLKVIKAIIVKHDI